VRRETRGQAFAAIAALLGAYIIAFVSGLIFYMRLQETLLLDSIQRLA